MALPFLPAAPAWRYGAKKLFRFAPKRKRARRREPSPAGERRLLGGVRLFALFLVLVAAVGQREGRRALVGLLLLRIRLVAALPAVLVRLLLRRLLLLILLLGLRLRRHDAVIVLGVLEIILRHDAVAGRVGVARELQIFLIDVRCRAADFHLRAGRVERAVRIVSAATAAAIVVAAACVLRPAAASA